jgi:hypothetical protein
MGIPFITGYVLGSRDAALTRSAATAMRASTPESKVLDLHDRVDRLVLIVEAMWSLLEETGLTEEQLLAKISELDTADGVADGRITRAPTTCPACGSASPAGRTTCQVCGGPLDVTDPFAEV